MSSQHQQKSLSSYFGDKSSPKTRNQTIDLTNDDQESSQPPIKRRRTDEAPANIISNVKEPAKPRKTSSTIRQFTSLPEKTAIASTSKAQRVRKTLHVTASPPSSPAPSLRSRDGLENEDEGEFKKVMNAFANKSTRKGKQNLKEHDNIGPSGQTWTPLELQVRDCIQTVLCI